MKFTLRLFVLFTLAHTNLLAQNFWVPDSNFRNKLKQVTPSCFTAQDSLITNSSQLQFVWHLNLSNLSISSLDGIQYFTDLEFLYCDSNQLSNLPALSPQLEELHCRANQLISLPVLPPLLQELICNDNKLTSLPALPSLLTILYCQNNPLGNLPTLPESLKHLRCYNNQLSSLPRIPGNMISLYCSNNPITCFPEIAPRLPGSLPWQIIGINGTLISCIPNFGTFPLSIVVSSSQTLPICAINNKGCNYNYTVGYVFIDANGNGIKNSFEQGFVIPVFHSGNSGVFPDSSGFFYAASDTGNISFQVTNPLYYIATTPSTQTTHVVSGIVDSLFFGMLPIYNVSDLKIDLTSIGFLRPGFKTKYMLQYQNVGTNTQFNVKVKFLKPSQLSNLSATPSPNLVIGDTLIWDISSLQPFQTGSVEITDSIFVSATLGLSATAFAWIEPLVGDTTPLNNLSVTNNTIQGSFDPNDKSVNPREVIPNSTAYLNYIIRFQNTGTDTAFTVTLMDTLSTLLDIYSMQMISASHNYELIITDGIAKWTFKNILLPDSNTNELESHGFVKFKISPLPGLTVNDSIQNLANIYFDFNQAVTTNTVVVNVNLLNVKELPDTELKIFPNPLQESLRIVNQHSGPLGKIELINASGKVLEIKTISTSTYTWNLQHLPAGTYILKGQGWGQKVVKE